MFCFFGGGLGGNPEGDGLNHGNNPISTATIPPLEILEVALSGDVHAMGAAAGQRRPGQASRRARRDLRDRGTGRRRRGSVSLGERGKYPPPGANGGGTAALNRFVYETDSGEKTPALVSKVTDVKIRRGQKVRLETPGGGGFGNPAERDPAKIARDVRLGYVTAEAARRDYKARA